MNITLDLPDELTAEVTNAATRAGMTVDTFAANALLNAVRTNGHTQEKSADYDYSQIGARLSEWKERLTEADRTTLYAQLQADAEALAPLYAADFSLPEKERELTAFEILNEYDPLHDYPEEEPALANR